jgi:sulfur carrier protein
MHLTVNGKKTVIGDKKSISIYGLLDELNVPDPLYVTVELNGEMERTNFDSVMVKDGDEIEFLYFMGGGEGAC